MNEIEKALDILKRLRIAIATSTVDGFRVLEPLGMAISALEKQLKDGWIPVAERLPEKYGCYLVAWKPINLTFDDIIKNTGTVPHYYEIAEFDPDDEALWIGGIEQCKEYEIFAWQPLPEPFKGGENE